MGGRLKKKKAGVKKAAKKRAEKKLKTVSKEEETRLRVWMPGMPLEDDEQMEHDPSAYLMFHQYGVGWPCLSFDCVKLGIETQVSFPIRASIVTGTQAAETSQNEVVVLEWGKLTGSNEEDDDEGEEQQPEEMQMRRAAHPDGGINRIRCGSRLTASWSESGKIHLWDHRNSQQITHVQTISAHDSEGFALAWNRSGDALISGDCSAKIQLSDIAGQVSRAFDSPHNGSVEDLVWSPGEPSIFASASSDGTLALWDIRETSRRPLHHYKLHDCDINVMAWNPSVHYLLATGAEDGGFSTWDLRAVLRGQRPTSPASFDWHKQPITSIDWHPRDASVLAVSSEDHSVSLWDLAVERDEEVEKGEEEGVSFDLDENEIPEQLLFLHHQADPKEVRWCPEAEGVLFSTGSEGFHVFRTISI